MTTDRAANLLHNAIIHNLPEKGTVQITTGIESESAVLSVENTGERLSPRLMAPNPSSEGTERVRSDYAGVGLGLAIVKSITRAHDGTLSLSPRAAGDGVLGW